MLKTVSSKYPQSEFCCTLEMDYAGGRIKAEYWNKDGEYSGEIEEESPKGVFCEDCGTVIHASYVEEELNEDVEDYNGTGAFSGMLAMMMESLSSRSASDSELVDKAINAGIDLEKYNKR